jgi:hypothetical protein
VAQTQRPSDDESLVNGYWEYRRLVSSDDRTDRLAAQDAFWAWDAVQDRMCTDSPAAAVGLLVDLADAAPDDEARLYLGAGSLEDLLHDRHPEVVDLVEEAARRIGSFRMALSGVWLDANVPPDVAYRLGRLLGPPL